MHNLHSGKLQVADMQGGRKADLLVSESGCWSARGRRPSAVRDARERLLEGDEHSIARHLTRCLARSTSVEAKRAPALSAQADEPDVLNQMFVRAGTAGP